MRASMISERKKRPPLPAGVEAMDHALPVELPDGEHAVVVGVEAVELRHRAAPLRRAQHAVVVGVELVEAGVLDAPQDGAEEAAAARAPVELAAAQPAVVVAVHPVEVVA